MSISVNIQAEPSGGIKIIQAIPAFRPCRLEGKNGVGKSLAVRLLRLVTGQQPYADDPSSWRSLREHLGPTIITISGLAGFDGDVVAELTPESWPANPITEVGSWLGRLRAGTRDLAIRDLSESLQVIHLVGTERLIDTVNRRRGSFEAALDAVDERVRSLEEERGRFGLTLSDLEFMTEVHETMETAERARLTEQLRKCKSEEKELKIRLERLQQASAMNALIESGNSEERARELAGLRTELAKATQDHAAAVASYDQAVERLARGNRHQQTLAAAERKATRALRELSTHKSRLAQLLQSLGIGFENPIDTLTSGALDQDLAERLTEIVAESRLERRKLEKELHLLRLSTIERQTLEEVRVVLGAAVEAGASDFVLANVGGIGISVRVLLEALDDPPGGVDGSTESDDVKRLRQRETAATAALTTGAGIPELRAKYDEALREIERLQTTATANDDLEGKVREKRQSKQQLETLVETLSTRLGSAQQSGPTPENLEEARVRVEELLAAEGVSADALQPLTIEIIGKLGSLRMEHDKSASQIAELSQRDARRRVLRRSLPGRLLSDPTVKWILGDSEPREEPNISSFDEIYAKARRFYNAWNTLARNVESLADTVKNPEGSGAPAEALKRLIQRDALEDLSEGPIREALFGNGNLLSLDLDQQSVTWETAENETRTRPLSAFSSGEQALGFVRARLRQVAESGGRDRLVFLDEFGAFISADRRKPLADLLHGEELGDLVSQIVVVLPLQADYERELKDTTGTLRSTYARRAAEIEKAGYFTEVFAE